MESEESRGDTVEDQQAGGGEAGEAETQVIEQEEEEDGIVEDDNVVDESKEEGEVVEDEEEDKAASEETETLEKTVIDNNSSEGAEDAEEEGISDSKDELEDKGGGEEETEEGVASMDEVEGQPNEENLEGEEEPMDDGDAEETEQLEESHGGEVVGEELDEEAMEEGEEEEEENGERPGAVEEEDEEDERMPDIQQEENTDGQVVKRNAAAVMAASGVQTRKRTLSHSSTEDGPKRKVGRSAAAAAANVDFDGKKHDKYCWVCHKESVQVNCKLCPRSYHVKCMSMDYPNAKISQDDSTCICPECVVVMNAETLEFRSDAMKQLTLDQLLGLLKNICLRMRQTPGSEPFVQPVDPSDAEDYFDYIVYPMDIETLEKNIRKRLYGSTEGFLADAQWLVHNSIVFNSASSQYTLAAKRLLKVCKQELTEIETCPECYTNAHEKPDSWFVEACRRPHILVWAKLKGFPFWPAKAMKIKDNDVDVRFFGQHDRAWVSKKDCFLYSEEMPAPPPKKNGPLLAAIEELTAHVEKLKEVHGPVLFASVKTPIGPQLSSDQIRRMLPEFTPQEQGAAAVGGAIKVSSSSSFAAGTATTSNIKPSNNNNNNNNNNSVNKVPPPTKKSPMTIRISSLKTNPTIVNISTDNSPAAADGRVVTRLTRKSSSAASAQQSNNPSGESDQDQSNDEGQQQTGGPRAPDSNKGEDNEDVEEDEEGDNVPEQKAEQDETEEEEAATTSTAATAVVAATQPSLPKGSEILASALGGGGAVRRSTRGLSRSGEASESSAAATPTSATPQLEKRLTRGALKTTTPAEDGNNGGDSVSDEQPSDAVMEALGLSKKSKETPPSSGGSLLRTNKVIKEEPQDDMDVDESEPVLARHVNKSAHNTLMEQLTIPTSVKPGYRFNLSKDISISAVEGGGMADQDDQLNVVSRNVPQQRRMIPGGQQRSVPQGIPMNAVRPRLPVNTVVNGQPRAYTGQQLRQMVRNARPQHILNPRTGQTIRIAGAGGGTRPVSMLPVRGQQQQYHVQQQQKAAKDAVVVDSSSLVNPVQGPITLPGGTITVTPLTSLIAAGVPITTFDGVNGAQSGQAQQVAVALKAANASGSASNIGIINVQQQTGGGTTIVNSKQGKTGGGGGTSLATAQQRRNLMVSIPPSVNMHLQNLTKTMGDLVKSTVEQITIEIVDFCNNTQGKAENSRLQVEVEKLQKQLKQEVTDIKHNNDIAMRELRMTMENDKKRSLQEVKRQMEAEKQKAIEETKKKQWCASCGREALFYCCWNTSYCGYPCQEEHWPTHMASCSQSSNSGR